ncbi:MAG TPA: pilus assembly protein TadG-related protein [Candidatus Sulfotelmatobacter sp.]|nr:pilus assembly protein TadG-related protein [Candidatus Sulfotelmatobacter sp.]
MKAPLISKRRIHRRERQHGVTMVLVALAMVAIIAIAALSIDVITLYLAKEEAQRSADAAALAAANVLSLSGITGDPTNQSGNWKQICGPDDGTNGLATRMAKAVANQNLIGGAPVTAPTVTYSSAGTSSPDCTSLNGTGFGVNPLVTVQLSRANLPSFFSRIWGNSGTTVTATATAEAFNPSNSANSGNTTLGAIVPVQPRCVKPWVVPNQDPLHNTSGAVGTCTGGSGGNCAKFVSLADGSIVNQGISLGGTGVGGVIGETFWLSPDCHVSGSSCSGPNQRIGTPQANYSTGPHMQGLPDLLFVPGQVGTPVIGVPSCTTGNPFEEAIEGCDQSTNYTCGVLPASGGTNVVDLSENPDTPTSNGVSCLIHQATNSDVSGPTGQDYFNAFKAPSSYPFQIYAGSSNPAVGPGLASGTPISVSSSIVSLPIYDETTPLGTGTTPVTFVGFLQVFINATDQWGNVNVTVLNVAGCSNSAVSSPVIANSPIPVRLITPP